MTVLPRAATGGELAKLRHDQQHSKLFLTIHAPTSVFSARLAAVPASNDSVTAVTYNTGAGTFGNIVADQTLLVGTTPGGFDLGMARVRNLAGLGSSSGTFNIGEISEIQWASSAYLTVLDEILLNRRDPRVLSDGTILMDWDIAYSDQHAHCASIPVLGPPAVKWLTGASVNALFDASNSWTVNNSITGYAWAAPGASASSGMTTATPTISYNAIGQYRVACTITNSDGVSSTGYRWVFIVNDSAAAPLLIREFNLDTPIVGDYNSGGWSFQVTLSGQASLGLIRNRAMAILHARDWYGPTANDEGSIGCVADRENIIAVGWIALEADQLAALDKYSTVTFTVYGPAWWVSKPTAFPVTVKDKNQTVTKWTRFFGATLRAATWHIWNWRTTAPRMMDVYPMPAPGDAWRAARFDAPGGQSPWEQLKTILKNNLIAAPSADRYGRVFMQREQNTLDAATRSSIPTVMTITRKDWYGAINFERRQVDDIGYVNFSGVAWDGVKPFPMFALAPGHVPGRFGGPAQPERLILQNDHTIVNTFAGAYHGWRNPPYPRLPIALAQHNPLIDIAPAQYCEIDFAASDTLPGFVDNRRIIPRIVRWVWNKPGGFFTTEMEVEGETAIRPAITGDTPATPPPIPVTPPPLPIVPPDPVPRPSGNAKELWLATSNRIAGSGDYFNGGQPTFNLISSGLPGSIVWFNLTDNGATAYVGCSGAATISTLWKSTDIHNAVPTWTQILAAGDALSGGFVATQYFSALIVWPEWDPVAGVLRCECKSNDGNRGYYGEYNGTSWTWRQGPNTNDFSSTGLGYRIGNYFDSAWWRNYNLLTGAIINDTDTVHNRWWHGTAGRNYGIKTLSNVMYLRQITTAGASTVYTLGAWSSSTDDRWKPWGAHTGTAVFFSSPVDNTIILSEDGTSFTSIGGAWGNSFLFDSAKGGGGQLARILLEITASGVPTRLYNRDGSVLRDMTGNFWSLFSGNQSIVGAGIVYG